MDMPLTAIGKLHCWMSIYWGQSFTPEFYKDVNLMWGQFISWLFSSNELSEHGRHLNTCHETAIRAWKTFECLPWKCYQSMEDIWILAMKLLSEHGRHLNICHETVWSIDMFQSSLINKTTHYYDTSNILTVVSSRRQTSVMLRLQLLGCHTFSLKGWAWTLTAEHPPISGLKQVISM